MPEKGVLYSDEDCKPIGEHTMILPFQPEFRPALPTVYGAKDYREFRSILEQMDRLLTTTGIENRLIVNRMRRLGQTFIKRSRQTCTLFVSSSCGRL